MATGEQWKIRHGSFRDTTSSGGALIFYDHDGTSDTLSTNERYAITDVVASLSKDGRVVVMGTSTAAIVEKDAPIDVEVLASSPIVAHFQQPFFCRKGIGVRIATTSDATINCKVIAQVRPG